MRTLRQRLEKEKIRLDKIALRDARTPKELLVRKRWDRINTILWRRYEQKDMPQLRG